VALSSLATFALRNAVDITGEVAIDHEELK
jgi:hypothetical protein